MERIRTSKGLYHYRPLYLYVGRKVIDREVAFQNLKDLVPILDNAGIRFGPIFGTLLGLIRENDFIAWDEDIDMYILQEEEDAFKDTLWALKEAGFELVRYDKRGLYSVMRNNEYIDFYVLRPVSGELRHTGGADFLFERYLQETIPFDFKGIVLRIPKDYDEYLTLSYGDWRTPRQYADFHQGKLQVFMGRLRWELKKLVPQSCYRFFIRLYRKKDADHFVQKCRAKGIDLKEEIRL